MNSDNRISPLVSVVIPVYNSELFLADAIGSVLNQDYPNLEVIAVDDGSQDGSLEILSKFGKDIRLIEQKNAGSAKARNSGLDVASGEYVAFLDADDFWHPSKIRLQVDHLGLKESVGLVYNNWLVIDEGSEIEIEQFFEQELGSESIGIIEHLSGWLYTKLLLDSLVHTSSAMIRRSIIDRVGGFDESLRKGQDYDYWIRLSRQTQFDKLSSTLSTYRIHSASITQQPSPTNYAARVVINSLNNWGRVGPDGRSATRFSVRKRLAGIWLDFACAHLDSGNIRIARGSLCRSLRYAPWSVAGWKQLIKSILKSASS